jgi:hypothetical protein
VRDRFAHDAERVARSLHSASAGRMPVSKVYNDEEMAKRVFVIVMCGVLLEIAVMLVIAL